LVVCPSGCQFTTLAAAIAAASNGDKIRLDAGTFEGGVTIDKDVSLIGSGAGETTITGPSPVVAIAGGATATISSLTISGGSTGGGDGSGGGIANAGTLVLKDSTVSGNTALLKGGGIYNSGTLSVFKSTVSGNATVGIEFTTTAPHGRWDL
jgi:predicted outer membrane repeat protein